MESLLRNVRYSFRVLVRTPGFTATVILILALGIGATSAVFCAIDGILLRPLPFPQGERLVRVSQFQGGVPTNVSPARLEDWQRHSASFESISGYYIEDVSDTTYDLPEKVMRASVAPRFMDVLRAAPRIGRGFEPGDYQTGNVVLISERYWRSRFGADPGVLGRSVRIADRSLAIIGVLPQSFDSIERSVDLWMPVTAEPARIPRQAGWYIGVGRLKAGVEPTQAQSDLARVQMQLAQQFPQTDRDIAPSVVPLQDATSGRVSASLWFLFGAVSLLLLIACTNIAAMLLSRSAQREQEVAICLSLGASRTTVAARLLTETAILAFCGAVLGVLLAAGIALAFRALAPDLPRLQEVEISWRVVLFAMAAAVVVTVLCGLMPAIRSTAAARSLQSAGRTQVSTRHSLQWGLVAVQIALSVTLLAGAGLLLRSFDQLSRVERGVEPGSVLTFNISGGFQELADYDRLIQRINTTLDDLESLPGVRSAATASVLPGIGNTSQVQFELVEGGGGAESAIVVTHRTVSPSYFRTVGIPLLSGELCRRPENTAEWAQSRELLVNRRFAEQYLAGRAPVGLHLRETGGNAAGRIVGIVGDAREVGIDRAPVPVVYSCMSAPSPTPAFLVRTEGDPMALSTTIRRRLTQSEPLRSVYDITPLEQRIDSAFAQHRLRMILLAVFAAAALVLACLGVYGTLSYAVTLRQREIGLLLALGALRSNIVRKFVMEALVVVGIGCVVGMAVLLAFAQVLSGMLFGVAPADPAILSSVTVIVLTVAAVAALLPSVRAALLDPMRTLRQE